MDKEKQLEKQFQEYIDIAKENKNVDVASLMINAMESQNKDSVSSRLRRWAYLISIGFPPLGVFFAIKFYFFDDKDDARHVGNVCMVLTTIAVVFLVLFIWMTSEIMLSGSGVNMDQLKQIDINGLRDLLQ